MRNVLPFKTFLQQSLLASTLLFSISTWAAQPANAPLGQDELAIDVDDIHHFISTLAIVKHHYLQEVSTKELINQAIAGMVGSLDPHSNYMNEQFFEQLQNSINGEFSGIGVEIIQEKGLIKVISPIEDGPAALRASSC